MDGRILLVEVEVPVGVAPEEWLGPEDYAVVARETFGSLAEALQVVEGRGVDTNTFDAVWKTENPF